MRQFVLSETSTAIGLVEFSSDARVLSIGGVNGLSFDADALMEVIDAMDSPSGWTHISAGLELGRNVMLGTEPNGTEPIGAEVWAAVYRKLQVITTTESWLPSS